VTDLLGIVLAGGRGGRLNLGIPKALATLGGSTLLARALAVAREVADEVIVCAPASLGLPVPASASVFDPEPGEGPLVALVAALRARPFARAIVLGVDLPFMTADALGRVATMCGPESAVVPAPGGRAQPLAAAYSPAVIAPLAAAVARGERALVPAVLALPPRLVTYAELRSALGSTDAYFNLNTPADLAEAGRRIATGAAR
jgi:molybdopterin-guanine dinucleotide biosynthesis protein A